MNNEQRTTNNEQRSRAKGQRATNNEQQSTRNAGILPAMGRVRTPALPANPLFVARCPLPVERRQRRAAPANPLLVARCSLLVERRPRRRAAFSLAEILIAIFVLSIGLIMVAAVFPIAAKWTAEDAQSTIAQVIAKDAVAQIKAQYDANPTGFPATVLAGTDGYGPFCYNFGNASPYPNNANPAPTPDTSTTPPPGSYYWSAYIIPATTPAGSSGIYAPAGGGGTQGSNLYTIYIFVFNKGDLNNTFTAGAGGALPMQPVSQGTTNSYYPQLYSGTMSTVVGKGVPTGSQALDMTTGQVFRVELDSTGNYTTTSVPPSSTTPNPYYTAAANHSVLYAPPAINQTASPLIYIYVTTVNL